MIHSCNIKNFDALGDMPNLQVDFLPFLTLLLTRKLPKNIPIQAIWLWGNPIECTCESDRFLKKIESKNITLDSPVMDYRGEKFRFKKEFEPKDSKCILVDR